MGAFASKVIETANTSDDEAIDQIMNLHRKFIGETTSKHGINAVSWTFPKFTDYILSDLSWICFTLLLLAPLLEARRSTLTWKKIGDWWWTIGKGNMKVEFTLAIFGLTIATLSWLDPSYAAGKHVLVQQVNECAFHFEDLACEGQPIESAKRECFALGMCLAQPLLALTIQTFLRDWWYFFVRVRWNFHLSMRFIYFLGIWILPHLSNETWPLGLGYVVNGNRQAAPVQPPQVTPIIGFGFAQSVLDQGTPGVPLGPAVFGPAAPGPVEPGSAALGGPVPFDPGNL
ncbi:hypothetical protein VTL71DRAFT_13669 [Oculimacula yallundae]|uniref:Uncharacterized protein n=1 Tax=Oculimacula yallundae TaxID=86028 RepID=A0ABR4CN03_9HELO